MLPELSIPEAMTHPVAIALRDPDIRRRLMGAARAFVGRPSPATAQLQSTAELEVIVQEACLRAWSKREEFDQRQDVVTWLNSFIRNIVLETKRARRRTVDPPDDGPSLAEQVADSSRPVDETVLDHLFTTELLNRLPALERQILRLKYFEDKTCAEIGPLVDLKENAVRMRLFRAKEILQAACGVTEGGQS